MLSLIIFLQRMWRKRDGEPSLLSVDRPDHRSSASRLDRADPSDSDLSYEDALFDSQMRHFFRSEFGDAEPPSEIFSKVMLAIRHSQEADRAFSTRPLDTWRALIGTACRALAGPAVARIVPSGVALTMMVTLLGSHLPQMLGGEFDGVVRTSSSPTPSYMTASRNEAGMKDQRQPVILYNSNYDPPETWAPPGAYEPYRSNGGINIKKARDDYKRTDVGPE